MKAIKKTIISSAILAASVTAASGAMAADWSSTSILLLNGHNYELGEDKRQILTLDHANGWKYGGNFFTTDITEPSSAENRGFFFKYAPTLSFSKISGKDMSFGFVKDVSLAATVSGSDFNTNKFVGIQLNLDIPYFAMSTLTLQKRYYEDKLGNEGDSPYATIAWAAPFALGSTSWVFEGFADYFFAIDSIGQKAHTMIQPRLLIDTGAFFGAPKSVYAGIEMEIADNKFGNAAGIDERAVNLALKWTF